MYELLGSSKLKNKVIIEDFSSAVRLMQPEAHTYSFTRMSVFMSFIGNEMLDTILWISPLPPIIES